ncbi:hypothetical protein [Achromobacter sp. B7]|nr:hypothetical protein [Achromobacter sp. B7]
METNDCREKKRDISLSIIAFSRKSPENAPATAHLCAIRDNPLVKTSS